MTYTSRFGGMQVTDEPIYKSELDVWGKNKVTNVDPVVGNDNTEGYSTISRWINTLTGKEFVCTDASTGAAVWTQTTNLWNPTALILGAFTTQNVTPFNAVGAGHLFTFPANQPNSAMRGNVDLDRNGKIYDGSDVAIHLHWQPYNNNFPAFVRFELKYAFCSDGDDNYTKLDGTLVVDVPLIAGDQRKQQTLLFPNISGLSGASVIQVTVKRLSVPDTYNGDADVYSIGILKQQ